MEVNGEETAGMRQWTAAVGVSRGGCSDEWMADVEVSEEETFRMSGWLL